MAYQLKYYKGLISQGHRWRLEIYQDTDESLQAVEIGPVLQGLRLIVQGDQADIDTPIVKTSMEMVFVDAPDLEEERKCGYWEEFYTSSATEYKVMLIKDDVIEWTGYITPDSFSESLQYRGSVSIIARDNLGALQDFEYDAIGDETGLITLHQVLDIALQRISFPMQIAEIKGGSHKMPESDTFFATSIEYILFNSSSFRNKTWNEVIEDIFFATGLTLRYVGHNTFALNPIRDIPLGDYQYWWDVPILNTQFCAYGQRELSPAAKSIKEEVTFDIKENILDSYTPASAFGEVTSYLYEGGSSYYMPIHVVNAGLFKGATLDNTILLDVFRYKNYSRYGYGKGGAIHNPDIIYLAGNDYNAASTTARQVSFSINLPAGQYKIALEVNKIIALYDNNTAVGYADYSIDYWRFSFEAFFFGEDGSVKTLSNRAGSLVTTPEWKDGNLSAGYLSSGKELPHNIETPILTTEVAGVIKVILHTPTMSKNTSEISKGGYLGISNIAIDTVDNSGNPIMDGYRLNTRFNEKNNVILSRNPKYAPNISTIISTMQIQNAIYVRGINGNVYGSDEWIFNGNDLPKQLAVLLHQQLLAYYAKPNNVLSGELAIKSPAFNALYEWNGKLHLLTSGALNVITGRMENAVLREFMRYDHMWETWVETEDIEVDYAATSIQIRVHSNETITSADLNINYRWISASVQSAEDGVYIVTFELTANSNTERTAIISIDTTYVRITQLAPGDYGVDYGEDYS